MTSAIAGPRDARVSSTDADLFDAAALVAPAPGGGIAAAGVVVDGVPALADALYAHWYCRLPVGAQNVTATTSVGPPMAARLRAAHAGSDRFAGGWRVTAVHPGGYLSVTRPVAGDREGVATRVVGPGDYVCPARPGVPPGPGEPVAVVGRIDDAEPASGFWCSQRHLDPPPSPHVRLYWNAGSDAAPTVVRALTATLASTGADWSMKAPLDPVAYGRCDSVVLYLPAGDLAAAVPALARAATATAGIRRAPTPPLSRRLAPGLGAADDPPGSTSFGAHRCLHVATGLLEAWSSGHPSPAAAVGWIRSSLVAAGVDLDRPHRTRTTASGLWPDVDDLLDGIGQ